MSDVVFPDWRAPARFDEREPAVALGTFAVGSAWNLQGIPESPAWRARVRDLFGFDMPSQPNTTAQGARFRALWLGPTSWLLVGVQPASAEDFPVARDALNAASGALFDVSAGRVAFRVEGGRAQDVLGCGCPLDLHPRVFATGECRQSLFGHAGALLYKRSDRPAFALFMPRSYARDTWQLLCVSAAQFGFEVTAPEPF